MTFNPDSCPRTFLKNPLCVHGDYSFDINAKRDTHMVFLDLSKAFDVVNQRLRLANLEALTISPQFVDG